MVFTPLSHVLLRLLISLLGLQLGLIFSREAIFDMPLVLWVGDIFSMLRL